MQIELLDDCEFEWKGIEPKRPDVPASGTVKSWFLQWAKTLAVYRRGAPRSEGLFLIHANARFTLGGHRQNLEGVEVLGVTSAGVTDLGLGGWEAWEACDP